jgi:hypothetical protein
MSIPSAPAVGATLIASVPMDVSFGVQARDGAIRAVIDDDKLGEFKKQIEEALSSETRKVLWVKDKEGREIGIPSDKIAFVEFGTEKASRQVGFSAAS